MPAGQLIGQQINVSSPRTPIGREQYPQVESQNNGMESNQSNQQDGTCIAGPQSAEIVSPDWVRLPPQLEDLLRVVPDTSEELERTTLLTWLYQSKGVMRYDEVIQRVSGDAFPAIKRRSARRALVGLTRIGAIKLVNIVNGSSEELVAAELDDDSEKTTRIASNTHAILIKGGMTWMNRAWSARHYACDSRRPGRQLDWAHKTFLAEEEEGKGNDAHWIENMRAGEYSSREVQAAGEVTAWIGQPVSSVFDLHMIISPPTQSKGQSKRA